jgi:hypothetical protein
MKATSILVLAVAVTAPAMARQHPSAGKSVTKGAAPAARRAPPDECSWLLGPYTRPTSDTKLDDQLTWCLVNDLRPQVRRRALEFHQLETHKADFPLEGSPKCERFIGTVDRDGIATKAGMKLVQESANSDSVLSDAEDCAMYGGASAEDAISALELLAESYGETREASREHPLPDSTCGKFPGMVLPKGVLTGAASDTLWKSSHDDLDKISKQAFLCTLQGSRSVQWAALIVTAALYQVDAVRRTRDEDMKAYNGLRGRYNLSAPPPTWAPVLTPPPPPPPLPPLIDPMGSYTTCVQITDASGITKESPGCMVVPGR